LAQLSPQTVVPSEHEQVPDTQDCSSLQDVPQEPQFAWSVCVLMQLLPQATSPLSQVSLQVPEEQTWLQATPHLPQFAPSAERSAQLY